MAGGAKQLNKMLGQQLNEVVATFGGLTGRRYKQIPANMHRESEKLYITMAIYLKKPHLYA